MQPSDKKSSVQYLLHWVQITLFACILLYFGRVLFIPLLFGLLIALILYPVCKKLEARKWSRSLAITISLTFIVVLFSLLIWLLIWQLNLFVSDLPQLSKRLSQLVPELQSWTEKTFGISVPSQTGWIRKLTGTMDQDLTQFLKSVFSTTVSTLVLLAIIPIYASLFLYHRETFVRFLEEVVGKKYKLELHVVLQKSVFSYFHFVRGTFYVYIIVGVLNSIGLLALGIQHAMLYGMLTAFMTIIPYIGIIVSAAIPISIALITKDSAWYAIGIVIVFSVVQYLEANVIFPRIVGEQLNLSTWATLFGMIAGSILLGVSGMILSIPFLGILKIVSDHIPEWKPLNIILNRDEGYNSKKTLNEIKRKKLQHVIIDKASL